MLNKVLFNMYVTYPLVVYLDGSQLTHMREHVMKIPSTHAFQFYKGPGWALKINGCDVIH